MRLKRLLGRGVGYSLFLLALLAALYGLTAPILFGLTYNSLFIALLSLGVAALSILFGAYILKAATGNTIALDVDTDRWRSVIFRGGQG